MLQKIIGNRNQFKECGVPQAELAKYGRRGSDIGIALRATIIWSYEVKIKYS